MLLYFRFVFRLNIFLVSPEGPQILRIQCYVLRNSKQSYLGQEAEFWKTKPTLFPSTYQLLKLEKRKCLYFCIFWLFFRDMVILWVLPYYFSKSIFYSTFSHILAGEENFVKIWLYSLFLKHNISLGCMNIDFYDGSKIGTFDTHL